MPKRETVTLFSSAARAEGNYTSVETTVPYDARGAIFFLDITGETGTATLDIKFQMYDPVGADWHDIPNMAFAQKSATGMDALTAYPGVVEVTTGTYRKLSWPIAATLFRAYATVGGTTVTMTFTLSAAYVD